MSGTRTFGWLLFFAVGWLIISPFIAHYEAGAQLGKASFVLPSFETPDGSNPLTLVWNYLNWFMQVFNFQTNPVTAFLTGIVFVPLTAIGMYSIIRGG